MRGGGGHKTLCCDNEEARFTMISVAPLSCSTHARSSTQLARYVLPPPGGATSGHPTNGERVAAGDLWSSRRWWAHGSQWEGLVRVWVMFCVQKSGHCSGYYFVLYFVWGVALFVRDFFGRPPNDKSAYVGNSRSTRPRIPKKKGWCVCGLWFLKPKTFVESSFFFHFGALYFVLRIAGDAGT